MIRRRAKAAGITAEIGCHTFRDTGITAYLANGGALEHAQEMARTKARVRPSFMTAPRNGSRKTWLSASGFSRT
jgi:integrase